MTDIDLVGEFSAALEQVQVILAAYGLKVVGAFAVLVAGWIIAGVLSRRTEQVLRKIRKVDPMLIGFIKGLLRYGVLAVTGVMVLNQFGVQTASLLAVLGAAGLAIGLALQGTLSHLAAGIMLLFFRPFRVGDYVEFDGTTGTVKHLDLFSTELATPDNVQIIVPNGKIWGSSIRNYNFYDKRRMDVVVGIDYAADIEKARKVLMDMVREDPRALTDPEPQILVSSLDDNAVTLFVRVWAAKDDFWPLKFALTQKVREKLSEAGIDIPFPQRVVHVVRDEPGTDTDL